jgi:hypothetical protein
VVRLIACICLLGIAPVQPDPYQVFARARQVWASQQYPDYMTYTVAVNVTERGVPKSKHYHLAYDTRSGQITVDPVSAEEKTTPPVPKGIIFHLIPRRNFAPIMDKRVGNPGEAVDYLGVPMIAPTYSFGMAVAGTPDESPDNALVAQIRKQFNDPMPSAKSQELASNGKIQTITSVTTFLRRYTIAYGGEDSIDGHDCYHLLLVPNYDPKRFRLREVWVDEQNYETRRLISAGNFQASQVPWLITFTEISGAQYIDSEVALAPVGVGDHRYEHASVSFQAIAQAPRPTRPAGAFATKENLMQEP